MLSSDILLDLVAHLQRGISISHGRRALLNFLLTNSDARLVLLFLLDPERQELQLLERCGLRPTLALLAGEQTSAAGKEMTRMEEEAIRLPVRGIFGMAFESSELCIIHNAWQAERCLPEERNWLWEGALLVMCQVGQPEELQGVLVLCYGSEQELEASRLLTVEGKGNLMICSALTGSYLTRRRPPTNIDPGKRALFPDALSEAEHRELRDAERSMVISQEQGRIARDLHDGLIQKLTHVLHKLDLIQRIFAARPEVALEEVGRAYQILQESVQDLRQSIASYLPAYLEGRNFDAAVRILLEEYEQSQPQLHIEYQFGAAELFPVELEAPAFYLLQEALNNIRKHANATAVRIQIRVLPEVLLFQISDNGQGFELEEARTSTQFGLRTMRERVELVNGAWTILSTPGVGTVIKARFPLRGPAIRLTKRERDVLKLLREGHTNREIADQLSISMETAKSHVHHIIQKMQVKDRTQAAVLATQQKWV